MIRNFNRQVWIYARKERISRRRRENLKCKNAQIPEKKRF